MPPGARACQHVGGPHTIQLLFSARRLAKDTSCTGLMRSPAFRSAKFASVASISSTILERTRLFSYIIVAMSTCFAPPFRRISPYTNSSMPTSPCSLTSRSWKIPRASWMFRSHSCSWALNAGSSRRDSNSDCEIVPEPSTSAVLRKFLILFMAELSRSMCSLITKSASTSASLHVLSTKIAVRIFSMPKRRNVTKSVKITMYTREISASGSRRSFQSQPPEMAMNKDSMEMGSER
mmetsp:Transcript_68472/g.189470  ORF Transcript_68472/g.189470 Transcript_68472/m.189470 type:complete len:236 (-) Transcript_68472:738-1445(-)